MNIDCQAQLQQAIAHHRAGRLQDAERLYRVILQARPNHPDANHNLGLLAIQVKQPAAALSHFKKALEANPRQRQFWLSYIDALIQAGQPEAARRVLRQARAQGVHGQALELLALNLKAAQSPSDFSAALDQRDAGRYQEAAEWLRTWLRSNPKNAEAHAHLAQILSLGKQDELAWKALNTALEIDDSLAVVQRNHARLLLKQQRQEEAFDAAQRAYESEPANPENLQVLAAVLAGKGQHEQAMLLLESALQAKPRFAEAMANRAALKMKMGRPAEALADAEAALSIKPHLLQVWPMVGSLRYQLKDLPGAIEAMETAVALDPDNASHLVNLGDLKRQAGAVDAAIVLLEKAVAMAPANANAWVNLGTAYQQAQRVPEAKRAYIKALALKPGLAEVANNLGILAKDEKDWAEALRHFDQALTLKPTDISIMCNRAGVLTAIGRPDEAATNYRQALEIDPDYAEAHCNLGITLLAQGRFSDAEASYHRALEISPDFAEAHYNLGNVYKKQGRLADAESSYRRALAIRADYADAHNSLGISLNMKGRFSEAEANYRRALDIEPNFADAHNNLGITLKELGRFSEAASSYRRALEIKPDFPAAYFNLGNTLRELGQTFEAEVNYRRALELKPDFPEALCGLGSSLKDQGRFAEAETVNRRALEINPDFFEVYSNLLFAQNYCASHAPSYCLEDARRFGRTLEGKITERFSAWSCSARPERLRVGLVSGDLHNHPVGYFLESLLRHLDPARIELLAYPSYNKVDTLTARLRPYFAGWKPLLGQEDASAAHLIHADGVHVLLDLSGHTARNRLPMFGARPAPVQASWLGYFATTGVSQMDYLIGDPYVTPASEEEQFTERVWRLPESYLCFTPPDVALTVGPLPAQAAGQITFGCFNNLTKMNDAVVTLWSKVLHAVPGARLFLKTKQLNDAAVCDNIRQRFSVHGISPDRLLLEGASPRAELLAAYNRVDIALDPFPYPGGTTSVEGLWMGVPVITRQGDRFLSHVGESIAHNTGMSNWIAADDDDYVAKAVAYTTNLEWLAMLRAGLRAQVLASPIFDAPRFARHFEAALWEMWQSWQTQQGDD